MLTVDVEAFGLRSKVDPLNRLIWGRFPEGDFGIQRIMSIAEGHDARLTMFLDYPEHYTYGESLLDVGREIARRGHDLNLHLHLDSLPSDYFAKRGLPEGQDLNTFSSEVATAVVDDLLSLHTRVTSKAPAALRGGGYRYNGALLDALHSRKIPLSSNYNQAAKLQPFDFGPKRQFAWDNGVVEAPIATLPRFLGRKYPTHFNFNISPFVATDHATALANSDAFLDEFYAEHGDDAVAVFVLHSWSFLRMDSGGEFSIVNEAAPERLASLLLSWSRWAEFVTAREVADLASHNDLALDGPITIPKVSALQPLPVQEVPLSQSQPDRGELGCPICETPVTQFVDFNGRRRQCPGCGSTERQRVFAELYPRFIAPELNLVGKDVLVAAPAASEKRFLKQQGISWHSIDVRPEVKADIIADLCNLDTIGNANYDAVIASFVLTCVHDLSACLAELHRVLKPGGRLLTCDPVRFGSSTVEHTSLERITEWYGREAYEKYRIGSFRSFGDVDLIRTLQGHGFVVKTLYGYDPATSSRWVWHMSIKEDSNPGIGGASTLTSV